MNTAIILVQPQLGENIGMVCRAMLNCGMRDLRLVAPRDGWPNPDAVASSSGATEVLDNARVFDTTEEAIADLHFVLATTARERDQIKTIYTPQSATAEIINRNNQDQKCGILFGRERSGLENDDIALANGVLNIPLNPDFSSLNLAQAVLLVGYQLYSAQTGLDTDTAETRIGDTFPAEKEKLNLFMNRLDDELTKMKFFPNEEMKPTILRNIRNTFERMDITEQELQTFHGIISALIGNKLKNRV